MSGIRSWIWGTSSVIDRESPCPLAGNRPLPIFPESTDAERRSVFHADGIRLLGLLLGVCRPFEKPINRDQAAPRRICIPKAPNSFAHCARWLASPVRVLAPIGDKAPAQRAYGNLAGFVIPADDLQVLARCGVPSGRIVLHGAVTNVQAIHKGITKQFRP